MNEKIEQIGAKAKELITAIEAERSDLYTEDAKQLMAVQEWKVAIEILCELLLEGGQRLSESSAKTLTELAITLGVETKYWQPLIEKASPSTTAG